MKLSRLTVGVTANTAALRDLNGSGLLPIQVEPDAGFVGTYRILGKVEPDAPWREIKASASAGFLESLAFVPFLQLEVLAKTGGTAQQGVNLWVSEG